MATPPLITLLSDFGSGSSYPAQMKGVIYSRIPEARVVDITHDVPHFDVLFGALVLEAAAHWFPPATVHCAVVDPGVGTARRALCVVSADGRRFVAPDNGLLTPFLRSGARVWEIADRAIIPVPVSATFHGRDLFAPVAAWVAGGAGEPARLGPRVERPVLLDWPEARREGGALFGECLAADPFGNVLTSIRASDVADLLAGGGSPSAEVQGRPARLVRTFGDGAPGELLALVGSSGRLEIAVREGSAAAFLGVVRGAPVVLRA